MNANPRRLPRPITLGVLCCAALALHGAREAGAADLTRLSQWERGVKVESRSDPGRFAYLWFYEWHLFDAVTKGEHTPGSHAWTWTVNPEGTLAESRSKWFHLTVQATQAGADLSLEVVNASHHAWPEIAAIIPCFNAGSALPSNHAVQSLSFLDETRQRTFFIGKKGLDLLAEEFPRAIHFNHGFRPAIEAWRRANESGTFVFSQKWPTSQRDSHAGLIVREAKDGQWAIGIAWDDFLSAQGHNPWNCMHLSVRVGPLEPGARKMLRGRIYLMKGSKDNLMRKFEEDFPEAAITSEIRERQ